MRRSFTIFLLALLVVVTGAMAAYALHRATPMTFHGTHLGPGMPAPDFTLVSADGPVSLSDFRGRAVLLFFGYTECPDACPFTMAKLRLALETLGDRGDGIQVLLITVDPDLDSPERLRDYARNFNPSFIGLAGSRAELEEVTKAYGVYAGEAPPVPTADDASHHDHGGHDHSGHGAHRLPPRLIDHTTQVFGIDRHGNYRLLWGSDLTADQVAEDLRQLLRL